MLQVLSAVLAIDNFLDGFGLAPVLREAFQEAWWTIMLLFACCVLLGAVSTAILRWLVPPASIIHTIWFGLATASILDGAMELCQRGLTIYVVLGMAVTWLFLFLGDGARSCARAQRPSLRACACLPSPRVRACYTCLARAVTSPAP